MDTEIKIKWHKNPAKRKVKNYKRKLSKEKLEKMVRQMAINLLVSNGVYATHVSARNEIVKKVKRMYNNRRFKV